MYKEGYTQKHIADVLGTYNTTIRRILIRNNVSLRSNKEIQKRINTEEIDETSNEFMYFIGLASADGNIYKDRFTLGFKESDKDHLIKVMKIIKANSNIHTYNKKGTNFYFSEFKVSSKELCNILKKYAVFVNKYTDAEILIPLNNHILRGLFDGDGCIHIPKSKIPRITITSKSKVLLCQIKNYLESIGIYSSIITHKTGVMDIVMANKVNTSQFLKHIYHDANISLHRKLLLATPYL